MRASRLLATISTAIVVALVTFAFLEFASVSVGLAVDLAGRLALATILGLAVLALGTAADVLAWPSRIGIARHADRRLDLGERLSTAIEVASRGADARAPVARALLADAERRAGPISPRTLIVLPYARYGLAITAAAIFAAISLAPPDRASPSPAGATAASTITLNAAEVADTGAELRRVATMMEADAAERDDPFLAALAREALRIGEEIEAGRLTDRDAVVAALDRLAGFAAEAYPTVAPPDSFDDGFMAEAPAEATQILRNLARERMAPATAMPEGTRSPEQPLVEPRAEAPADIPPIMGLPPTADVPNPEAPGDDGPEETGGARAPGDNEGYIEAEAMETFNDPTNYRAATTAGERPEDAAPIGPANNANTGQSQFAGAGQQTLEGRPAAEVDPFALGDDMLLTGQLDQTGRRIRIEMPPEMNALAIAITPGEATAMDWAPRREVEVQRTGVPLAARDLLARYFRAAAEAE